MSKTLLRIKIPNRLVGNMLLHEADEPGIKHAAFDVPATREGVELVSWWEKAANDERDAVMQEAYDKQIPITEAWQNVAESEPQNEQP